MLLYLINKGGSEAQEPSDIVMSVAVLCMYTCKDVQEQVEAGLAQYMNSQIYMS